MNKENLKFFEEINWKSFVNLATILSISMILFYSLGAYLHFRNIQKLK